MRDLHVVAVSEDGLHVVLATAPGASKGGFRVALDDRLRAAVKGELTGLGVVEGTISVKEIQARLRAGESEQEIARSAGVPLARVERFAGPILSEREQVVQAARRAVLVRGRRGASTLPLGEAVDRRLGELPSMRAESVVWTAYKGNDGRWTVEVSWFSRGHTRSAQWFYDLATRTVTSADPASAALGHVDDGSEADTVPASSRAAAGRARPAARSRSTGADDGSASGRPTPRKAPTAQKAPTARSAPTVRKAPSRADRAAGGAGRTPAAGPPAAPGRSTATTAASEGAAPSTAASAAPFTAASAGNVSPGTASPGTASRGAVAPGAVSPGAVSPGPAGPSRTPESGDRPAAPAASASGRPSAAPARGPRTTTAPDGLVVPAPGTTSAARRVAGRVAGVTAPPSRAAEASGEQQPARQSAVADGRATEDAREVQEAAEARGRDEAAEAEATEVARAADEAREPAQAAAPHIAATDAAAPHVAADPGGARDASAEEPSAARETLPGPPALRVVPPPADEPAAPPARRGRASVPGWADVLLSTAPPQEREQD